MMVFVKVHCESCGGTWEVYPKMRKADFARECPHCGKRIRQETWQGLILPAVDAVKAVNLELMKDHVNAHTGRFRVDFMDDSLFANAE